MEDLSFFFGILGNVISILVFASPIGTFQRVVKKKSTENFKGLPFVCTLLSTSLWSYYGLLKPGGLLVLTVNGVGVAMEAIYVSLFLFYAPKNVKVKTAMLVLVLNVGFLGLVIMVTMLLLHAPLRLQVVGFLSAALTLGMYASPMAVMRRVIVTKSVEYMPFFLFLNGGVWFLYSLLVGDFFIGVPNGIGFILGATQLIVYAVYRNSKSTDQKPDMEELDTKHCFEIEMPRTDKNLEKAEDNSIENVNLHKVRSPPKTRKQDSF
ncbi:hypothetical protein AMTRI_Chr02g265580 [Amborella trichopoda]